MFFFLADCEKQVEEGDDDDEKGKDKAKVKGATKGKPKAKAKGKVWRRFGFFMKVRLVGE